MHQKPMTADDYTPATYAQACGVSLRTVYRWLDLGQLPATQGRNRRWRISRSTGNAWIPTGGLTMTTELTDARTVLRAKEVAAYLNMAYITVIRKLHTGEIPGSKMGGSWRTHRADLEQMMGGHLPAAPPSVEAPQLPPAQIFIEQAVQQILGKLVEALNRQSVNGGEHAKHP